MKRIGWLLLTLLLAGCGSNPNPNPSGNWSILNPGNPVYQNAQGNFFFNFPKSPNSVNYLTKPTAGLTGNTLRMSFTVAGTGNPVFDYRTNPNNTCGNGFPGTIRLFIQRAGDDLSGAGPFQQYRYWSTTGFTNLSLGTFTISDTLDPSHWTDVYGASGSKHPDLFQAAVANAGNIGVTFGGGCFYGHGVFVNIGTASFTINYFGN